MPIFLSKIPANKAPKEGWVHRANYPNKIAYDQYQK